MWYTRVGGECRGRCAMGKFDDSIEWLNKQIANAREALGDLAAGRKVELNDKDVTQELKSNYERLIAKYEALIAAYQRRQ